MSATRQATGSERVARLVAEAIEEERRRIGQDLHDGLCQQLFSLAVLCDILRENLVAQSLPEAESAERITKQIEAAIAEARGVAHGLCRPDVAPGGLAAALRGLASRTSEDFRVACLVKCPDPARIASPKLATNLYRIAQEAVHNAIKHGKPKRIRIRLGLWAGGGRLSVMDDGLGISEASRRPSGLGLGVMRDRALAIGSELKLYRIPSGGTVVTCRFHNSGPNEPDTAAENVVDRHDASH